MYTSMSVNNFDRLSHFVCINVRVQFLIHIVTDLSRLKVEERQLRGEKNTTDFFRAAVIFFFQ